METFVVIMAGGRGERFWPKSTKEMPKQFLSLWGTDTLLQQAFARALKVTGDAAGVYVITGPDYEGLVRAQLAELPPENLIIEPAGRDTAPAVGYAAVYLGGRRKDAVMVVLPSDHVVLDDERFAETLRYAAGVAQAGLLVTIGIRPTRPEEGYGYIECGEPLPLAGGKAFRARRFTEKPRVEEALAFLKTGRYLWNAGIFVWTISAFRHALARHAPLLHEGLCQIERSLEEGFDAVREKFLTLERRSIDYALMEKAENIVVVPGDFGWDDVGTWAALERIYDKDENGNVIKGEAVAIEAGGNIIDNSLGDKLVVAFGVKDLVIVNSEDVVLVADKKRSGNLKKVTEVLRNRKMQELLEREEEGRPLERKGLL